MKLVFRKPTSAEKYYFGGSFVSNGVWAFNIQWLLAQVSPSSRALRNSVKAAVVKRTTERLNGEVVSELDNRVERVLEAIASARSEYSVANRSKFRTIEGYERGNMSAHGPVAVRLKQGIEIDIGFYAALSFDDTSEVLLTSSPIIDKTMPQYPVLIVNSSNETVGMIMPQKVKRS